MEGGVSCCPMCGGENFVKESGFFFCAECHTQSQELREEVSEYYVGERVGAVTKSVKSDGKEDEYTSWELYNYILKGMVDEVIGLGASKSLKVVVLQLWATYLKSLQIAFMSRGETPRLGINYSFRDAKLLHGLEKMTRNTKKLKRSGRRSEHASTALSDTLGTLSSSNQLGKSKRELAEAEYEKSVCDSASEFDENVRSLDSSSSASSTSETAKSKLLFSSAARRYYSDKITSSNINYSVKNMSRERFLACASYVDTSDSRVLCRIKLLAIINLALQILQEPIQLSDILRWVEEGELSFYKVSHFFPQDVKLKNRDVQKFGPSTKRPSHSGVRKTVRELALYLQATLEPPDVMSLVKRYAGELQLPREVVSCVQSLLHMLPPMKNFSHVNKELPNFEARAMALIIIVLKLLLGLDGVTEDHTSRVTTKLNKLMAASPRMFVWDEWVQYIECRKAFVASSHFQPWSSKDIEPSNASQNYIRFCEGLKAKDARKRDRFVFKAGNKMNPDVVNIMKHVFLKLTDATSMHSATFDVMPSLTPWKSKLEACLSLTQGETPATALLRRDFTRTTLAHLIDTPQLVFDARNKGITILTNKQSTHAGRKPNRSAPDECTVIQDEDLFCSKIFDLPAVAETMLLNQLKDANVKSKFRRKLKKRKHKQMSLKQYFKSKVPRETAGEFVLHVPYEDYWIYKNKNTKNEDFDRVMTQFPLSFQWLLKLCSEMLKMTVQDLYCEIVDIELLLCK